MVRFVWRGISKSWNTQVRLLFTHYLLTSYPCCLPPSTHVVAFVMSLDTWAGPTVPDHWSILGRSSLPLDLFLPSGFGLSTSNPVSLEPGFQPEKWRTTMGAGRHPGEGLPPFQESIAPPWPSLLSCCLHLALTDPALNFTYMNKRCSWTYHTVVPRMPE
jgi:hypothetical protein